MSVRSARLTLIASAIVSASATLASAAIYDDFTTVTPGAYPLALPTSPSWIERGETNSTVLAGQRYIALSNRAFTNYTGPFQPFVVVEGGELKYSAPANFRGNTTMAYGISSAPLIDLTADGATAFVLEVSSLSLPNGGVATLRFDIRSAVTTGNGDTDTNRSIDITGPGVYSMPFSEFNPGIDITAVNWFGVAVLTPEGGTFSVTSFGNNAAVPEPAALGLVGLPAVALLRRRR